MAAGSFATWMLAQEARALLTRLDRIKPFSLSETMVPAAAVSPAAQVAIDRYLIEGRNRLRGQVSGFVRWLLGEQGARAAIAEAHHRFTLLRLRFNAVLSQFDIFADVLTQRSESETGVWLAGLDAVAADALKLPGNYFEAPPVVCYLDRGAGAAIRRARTRLPGGGENPVSIVRMPRERMVGSGIASSLVHEVGHQAAALLELVNAVGPCLRTHPAAANAAPAVWRYWQRCLSEILADLYSVSRIGVGSTLGLMQVVSLPRAFVFRLSLDDPHPTPWLRVQLSAALGAGLYPDPQWSRLAQLWSAYYPKASVGGQQRQVLEQLHASIPTFVAALLDQRPPRLRGRSLREALVGGERKPDALRALWRSWNGASLRMREADPCLVFAAIGQAKADGVVTPEEESRLLGHLLTQWALQQTLAPGPTPGARRTATEPRRSS